MLPQRNSFKHLFAPISLSLILSACSGLNFNQSNLLTEQDLASSDYYLRQTQRLENGEEKISYQLLMVRALLIENKLPQAKALLQNLKDLSNKQLQDKNLIEIDYLLRANQANKANLLFSKIIFNDLSSSQKYYYLTLYSKFNLYKKDYLNSVNNLIKAEDYLKTVAQKQQNNDYIWNILLKANSNYIKNTTINTNQDPALRAWFDLANLYYQNNNDINALHQALLNWKSINNQFSVSYLLPTPLQNVLNLQRTEVGNIALLLPLSGKTKLIGESVKKGFEDGYGYNHTSVKVFDTSSESLDSILQQAKTENITTLVGPLLKEKVDELINRNDLSGFNILTLNHASSLQPLNNVCYYGLSPEDEAIETAQKLWKEGIKKPLVLVPKNTLGQRLAAVFTSHWQTLSGNDPQVAYYKEMADLRPILVENLGIIERKSTKNRKTVYRSSKSKKTNAIQAVFALGNSQQLADIKTAIDNTETELPLYTTSLLNSPNNSPAYRMLMNGTKFTDLPLFSDIKSVNFKQIANKNKGDYSLIRLYALGFDAWNVVNNFSEIKSIPNFSIKGKTGNLSANYACKIQRELSWFEYKDDELIQSNK